MKPGFTSCLFSFLAIVGAAQQYDPVNLQLQIANSTNDSVRYQLYGRLTDHYIEKKTDSALFFIEQCLLIAKKNNKKLNEAASLNGKGLCLRHFGRYSEALHCYLEAFEIANNPESERIFWPLPPWAFAPGNSGHSSRLIILGNLHMQMANLFIRAGNRDLCVYHFAQADKIGRETNGHYFLYYLYATMGIAYKNMGNPDSAMLIEQKALALANQFGFRENVSRILTYIGEIHLSKSQVDTARKYYHAALQLANDEKNFVSLVMIYFGLTKTFMAEHENDSSLYYAKKAHETLNKVGSISGTVWNPANAYENLFRIYKARNEPDSADKYMELAIRAKDSLNNHSIASSAQVQDLFLREQIRLKELEKEKIQFRNQVRTYSMLTGLFVLLLLAIIFYRNNLQKQKAKMKIERAYTELKSAQAQLIHQEKMASLGQLTAGIAHEIQNPLNFVNNFSDVNKELIDEMTEQLAVIATTMATANNAKQEAGSRNQGNWQQAIETAKSIRENEEKINHHGKRADAIVKGMLQHSATGTGQKELTDINALADEYLRLAVHGFKAKDKAFSAKVETDFDKSLFADETGIGKINVVPQEIGKVILNLLNNAFYAVNERAKLNEAGYQPAVSVSTRKVDNKFEIKVTDNGTGIPAKLSDRIFQPFFTTKPTGQGTGLGLSLAYDIVTKGHGGELKVKTREGQGSEFIIQLPIQS